MSISAVLDDGDHRADGAGADGVRPAQAGLREPAEGDDVPSEPPRTEGDVLGDNPLYQSGEMARVDCPAPRLDAYDDASMEAFLHKITDCLDQGWREQFGDTGMAFEAPNRIYWYASGQSPCGRYPVEGTAAFYCRANKGLYLGVDDIVASSADSGEPETYTFLLSHEYAHHVQGEAGILDYYHAARGTAGDAEERAAWTRRSELQANCLGGAFVGAIADSFPIGGDEHANILEDAERRSDYDAEQRTHGSPANGRMWTEHGMDRRDPAACNTWQAREHLVE
ncbi:neutral zinc metallopeptidase [Marinactinospora rubrisoli]|uniref:Neutral zinc metallopeptidase n=1 Tax=Marinactinospora rubrisoli TaxID=2715399 RepID=A0ABW2KAG7_9ACTN